MGLDPMTPRSLPKLKPRVLHLTDGATQDPQRTSFKKKKKKYKIVEQTLEEVQIASREMNNAGIISHLQNQS